MAKSQIRMIKERRFWQWVLINLGKNPDKRVKRRTRKLHASDYRAIDRSISPEKMANTDCRMDFQVFDARNFGDLVLIKYQRERGSEPPPRMGMVDANTVSRSVASITLVLAIDFHTPVRFVRPGRVVDTIPGKSDGRLYCHPGKNSKRCSRWSAACETIQSGGVHSLGRSTGF